MRTVLCPVNFTPVANDGLQYAQQLLLHWQAPARIILLHTYYMPLVPPYTETHAFTEGSLEYEKESLAKLNFIQEELQQQTPIRNITYQPEVRYSETAVGVARLARQENVDFIVMGTAGAHGMRQVLVGSTAADVLEIATCPVLVIPEGVSFSKPKTMVMATDLESAVPPQFNLVETLARAFGAEIAFLHVANPKKAMSEAAAREKFGQIYSPVQPEKVSFSFVENPDVEEGIIRFVRQRGAALLVMTMHAHLTWKDFFAASHTRQLAYRVEVPLLALHG